MATPRPESPKKTAPQLRQRTTACHPVAVLQSLAGALGRVMYANASPGHVGRGAPLRADVAAWTERVGRCLVFKSRAITQSSTALNPQLDGTDHPPRSLGADDPGAYRPAGPPEDGVVVLGVVVLGGNDDGGAGGSDASACGAGASAGSGAGGGADGSLPTPESIAALVGGVVMAGPAAGGAAGCAVVGAGFASGAPGSSVSQSTAAIDPKPTRNAATHASGTTTARPPILAKKERRPTSCAWSGARDSPSTSPCPRSSPSLSFSAAGSVCASPPSGSPTGSVASSVSRTTIAVVRRTGTIPQPYSLPKRVAAIPGRCRVCTSESVRSC